MKNKIVYTAIIISVLLRIGFVLFRPLWQAPDEYPHFYYIQHWEKNNSRPQYQVEYPYYQAHQPPLYYVCSAYILKITSLLFDTGQEDSSDANSSQRRSGEMIVLRFFSFILGLCSLALSWKIMEEIFPDKLDICKAAFVLLLFHPTFLSNTTSITNDALAVLTGTVLLYGILKDIHVSRPEVTGLLILIGVFTKSSLLLFLTFIALLVLHSDKKPITKITICLRICVPFLVTYGIVKLVHPFAGESNLMPPLTFTADSIAPFRIYQVFRNFFWSFWVAFGRIYEIHLSPHYYLIVFMPFSLAVCGGIIKGRKNLFCNGKKSNTFQNLLILLLIFFCSSIGFSMFFSFTDYLNTSWGKNIFPILSAVYVLFIFGLDILLKQRAKEIFLTLAGICFVIDCWALFTLTTM